MKLTSLLAAALLTGSALGLVPGVPNAAPNAVSSALQNAESSVASGLSQAASAATPASAAAAAAASAATPASAAAAAAASSSSSSSASAASASSTQIVINMTNANSRGAAAVKPKVVATVLLDTARNTLSTLSVPGLPSFARKIRSLQQRASHLVVRQMPALRWPYTSGNQKIRGVNLGGWLVMEPFITPGVFAATGNANIVDEWTFASLQPREQAVSLLQSHLNSFMTADDIRQIAAAGLNHVRIPIPYWAFGVAPGEPYLVLNQWDLLKQATQLCAQYNIKVIVDLHAAPGNQNGFEHGGRAGVNQWASNPDYITRTVNILQTMAQEFSQPQYANSVTAIEVLNEPVADQNIIIDFYKRAYEVVRYPQGRSGPTSPLLVVLHDAFISPAVSNYWNQTGLPPTYVGVAIDSHVYTLFDQALINLSPSDRLSYYCSLKPKWRGANTIHPQIIGEFTPAYTDCANGVNGRGTSSNSGSPSECYGKSGDASTFTPAYKQMLGRMWEAQVDAAEGGKGWLMWTWKTEPAAAEDWSYQKGLQYGWIPRNPTQRPQGIYCDRPSTLKVNTVTATKSGGGGGLFGLPLF